MDIAAAATYGAADLEGDEREALEAAIRAFEDEEDWGVEIVKISAS